MAKRAADEELAGVNVVCAMFDQRNCMQLCHFLFLDEKKVIPIAIGKKSRKKG
jgi:hypothetical protein